MGDRAGEPGVRAELRHPVGRSVPGPDGALLENYYGIGHSSAANYVAQVSGQAPSLGTQSDCPVWIPFPGQVIAGPYHQVLGEGCVYPAAVPTLGSQLSAAGRSWAAYLQDMGNDPGDGGLIVITFDEGSDVAACCGETSGVSPSHPNVPLPGKTGPGGGRIGAVLLSPLIRPGTVSTVAYNHYSLLRSIEDIFGLPHLGDAAMPQDPSLAPPETQDPKRRCVSASYLVESKL